MAVTRIFLINMQWYISSKSDDLRGQIRLNYEVMSLFVLTHQVQHMDVVVGKDAYYLLSHAGNSDRRQASREIER